MEKHCPFFFFPYTNNGLEKAQLTYFLRGEADIQTQIVYLFIGVCMCERERDLGLQFEYQMPCMKQPLVIENVGCDL